MKITFINNTKEMKGEVLFISVSPKNGSTSSPQVNDEIIKENGVKMLYLKCEEVEKMNLRKFYLLVRKMVQMAKAIKAEKVSFNFNDFKLICPSTSLRAAISEI